MSVSTMDDEVATLALREAKVRHLFVEARKFI